MKGIETQDRVRVSVILRLGSDHCPAMKGIETKEAYDKPDTLGLPKRPLPRNEGD